MAQKGITMYTPPDADPHINAEDDAAIWYDLYARKSGVMYGLGLTKVNNNVVRMDNGEYLLQGHVLRVQGGTTEDLTIDNGTQGQYRHDFIVAEYRRNGGDVADVLRFAVLKGVSSGTDPVDPVIEQDDLYAGGTIRQEVLFRVRLFGLEITDIDDLRQSVAKREYVITIPSVTLRAADAVALSGEYVGQYGISYANNVIMEQHYPDFRAREGDSLTALNKAYVNADIEAGSIRFRFKAIPASDITGDLLLFDGGVL